jgi:hypothetical protein
MVRALLGVPHVGKGRTDRAGHGRQRRGKARLTVALVLVGFSGCAVVPRARMDECQKLSQALRADNARLRDRAIALQGQNRDYAERAVDDAKRLAIQDEAIERLEHSVQAYQDERTRFEAAYKQMASSLGAAAQREPGGERIEAESPATREKVPGSTASARNAGSNTGVDDGTQR